MSPTRKCRTILVVDDEDRLRKALAKALAEEGRRTLSAASVAEARAILEENAVDLVITDLVLPDADGMALARHVRERSASTQIIVITAYGSPESEQEARALGIAAYFAKPFDLAKLRAKVLELLALSAGDWSPLQAVLDAGGQVLGATRRLLGARNVLYSLGRATRSVSDLASSATGRLRLGSAGKRGRR